MRGHRALDFLLANGLIHRVERLSAFVGCVADDASGHPAQFLICRACGRVTELDDHELTDALAESARRVGFAVSGATIEAEGLCHDCTDRPGTALTRTQGFVPGVMPQFELPFSVP